jgi:hypothetical protein
MCHKCLFYKIMCTIHHWVDIQKFTAKYTVFCYYHIVSPSGMFNIKYINI